MRQVTCFNQRFSSSSPPTGIDRFDASSMYSQEMPFATNPVAFLRTITNFFFSQATRVT
jgi:hypothetical protein